MSNDYEYLGDSQVPPVAPRPPTDAPAEFLTGLPSTPALKSNDDVDLESNRPPGNNNLSFSDGVNPKRSEPTLVASKISRSSESDEEAKESQKQEEKKPQRGGTCWCIFAAITIFLAVICLLGLGAFLLINGATEGENSVSAALNGTNETSSTSFETTSVSSLVTDVSKIMSITVPKEKTKSITTVRPLVYESSTKGVTTEAADTTEGTTSLDYFQTSSVTPSNISETSSAITTASDLQTSTTQTNKTENVEEAVPIDMTTSNVETIGTSTSSIVEITESAVAIDFKITGAITDLPTAHIPSSTEAITESTTNSTTVAN